MNLLILVLAGLFRQQPARVLDIYALDRQDPSYIMEMRLLSADLNGLKERDIIILPHFNHNEFKITLTGKDGGQKYSSVKILKLTKLYSLIDAMPMRREEISKKGHCHQAKGKSILSTASTTSVGW